MSYMSNLKCDIDAGVAHEIKELECPRCGNTHDTVYFEEFKNGPLGEWTHWTTCEETHEPILRTFPIPPPFIRAGASLPGPSAVGRRAP